MNYRANTHNSVKELILIKHGLRMPWRFLRGSYGRVALTVLAVATGVASVCSNSLTSQAVMQAFEDVIDTAAGSTALQVRHGDGGTFPKDVARSVARVRGVAQVVPVLTATAFTTDGTDELLAVHAFDIVDRAAAHVYGVGAGARSTFRRFPGFLRPPLVLRPGSIIVAKPFASRHGVVVGNRIDLDTPTGRKTFTIAGLMEPTGLGRLYGGNIIVMDLYAAQLAFAQRGAINRVDIVVKPGTDVDAVADRIRSVLPPGMKVDSPAAQKVLMEKTTRSVRLLVRMTTIGGLLAAFLIAFNSLSTLFESRVWEVGILRALGVRQRVVWGQLVVAGLLLGVLGVLIGIPLGLMQAQLFVPRITEAAALVANNVSPAPAPLALDLSVLLLAAVVGVGAGAAAAALPAWRAARTQIVETVRARGIEQRGHEGQSRWLFRVAILACGVIAVVLEAAWQSGAWGLVASALLILATALAARPVVDSIGPAVTARLGPLLGPYAWLGAAQIARRPRRTALAVAVLGVGVGSVLWLWMLASSFEQSVIAMLREQCRADLVVSSAHVGSAFTEAPVSDELLTRLRGIRGVGGVVGIRNTEVEYEGGTIALEANDREYFLNPAFGGFPLAGWHLPNAWESVASGEAAVASTNFLQNLDARVGDTVTLATPSGPLRLRIAGTTNQFLSPRGTLIMSRDLYARMWSDDRVSRAFLRLADGFDAAAVRAAITAALGREYSLRILSAPELIEYFASRVRAGFSGIYVHAIAMVVVVLVGMGETLAAEVTARTRELGVLRAAGARRRHIRRLVLAEALVLSVVGLGLACAGGLAQGVLWVKVTFPHLLGFVLALHIPYRDAALIALCTVGVCLVASLLPARRAARLQPTVAVRYE